MLSTIFVCFNMISVTVFKFDTFLVNYITLLFCQNKNISLSLSQVGVGSICAPDRCSVIGNRSS